MLGKIDEILPFDPVARVQFRFPLAEGASISLVHALGRVVDIHYTGEFCDVEAEVPESVRFKLAGFVH